MPHRRPHPADLQSNWDAFYQAWVHPLINVGTPTLVVFAILLAASRPLTRVVVTSKAMGPRSAHWLTRLVLGTAYAAGVLALLGAAVELVVGYPLLHQTATADGGSWIATVAIALGTVSCATVPVVFLGVGHAPLRSAANEGRAVAGALVLAAGVVIGGTVLLAGTYGLWWHYPWLRGPVAALVAAPVLAVAGLLVVARTRGLGIGLMIRGKDKTGADDSALGAAVRARLFDLGTRGPAGLTMVQQTDVSSIPSGALSLLPDGLPAKLAAALLSVFTPATPWLVDVTEQADSSIVVSVVRNGRVVEARTLRPGAVGLSQLRPGPTTGPVPAQPAVPEWSGALRTAAASFVLLTLSTRYEHVRAGLGGATRWRSVAQQVIASDSATALTEDQRRDLLAQGVGEDPANLVAQFGYLRRDYSGRPDESDAYVAKLASLVRQASREGTGPLRLRMQYTMVVALLNSVSAQPQPVELRVATPSDPVCAALVRAHALLADMSDFWATKGQRARYADLWHDTEAAIDEASGIVDAEWRRRFEGVLAEQPAVETLAVGEPVLTLWALYQRACRKIAESFAVPAAGRETLLRRALDDLTMAVAMPSSRVASRTDPSFDALHDPAALQRLPSPPQTPPTSPAPAFVAVSKAFKEIVGDPVPSSFLFLSPFADWTGKLADRGIHTATQLWQQEVHWLTAELGITAGVAQRWRSLAWLHDELAASAPGAGAAQVVFLLLGQHIGTVAELKNGIGTEEHREQLRLALIKGARPWAVVAPSAEQLRAWVGLAEEPEPRPEPAQELAPDNDPDNDPEKDPEKDPDNDSDNNPEKDPRPSPPPLARPEVTAISRVGELIVGELIERVRYGLQDG